MRLYRALLHLYPASFRADYGPDLNDMFARRLHEAAGAPGRALVWADAVADVVRNASCLHWDLLVQDLRYAPLRSMTRAKGGCLHQAILVAALGNWRDDGCLFNYRSRPGAAAALSPARSTRPSLAGPGGFAGYPRWSCRRATSSIGKRMATSFDGMSAYAGVLCQSGRRRRSGTADRRCGDIRSLPCSGHSAALGRGRRALTISTVRRRPSS